MITHIAPTKRLKGKIRLPASKSYSIRAFLVAACGGRSHIYHPSNCDDAVAARKAAAALGARLSRTKNGYAVTVPGSRKVRSAISVGESGTALRFCLPLAALAGKKVVLTGKGTLKGRPNHHLVRTLRAMHVPITGTGTQHSIPLTVGKSFPTGGRLTIDGTISSQFLSGLLLMTPQLQENSILRLQGKKIVSADYIRMTRQVLKKAGIRTTKKNERTFTVPGRQKYKGLRSFTVPSDYGLAAFHMAAAALTQSEITLTGYLKKDLVQADGHIFAILKKMGVRFTKTSQTIRMKRSASLKGGDFSLKTCPDLLPILAVVALFAQGRSRFYDIGHVRVKESDRISDLRKELKKVGAEVAEKKNELIVYPGTSYRENSRLDPHKDHRLAMAFCVLGLKLGVRVKDIECVAKSYPDFIRDFKRLGARVSRR